MFFFFLLDSLPLVSFFFFNDTATTEIYTLSLHDALPISVVITKKGKPVAKLVPPDEPRKDVFGCMAGTIKILRDMESPVLPPSDEWDIAWGIDWAARPEPTPRRKKTTRRKQAR